MDPDKSHQINPAISAAAQQECYLTQISSARFAWKASAVGIHWLERQQVGCPAGEQVREKLMGPEIPNDEALAGGSTLARGKVDHLQDEKKKGPRPWSQTSNAGIVPNEPMKLRTAHCSSPQSPASQWCRPRHQNNLTRIAEVAELQFDVTYLGQHGSWQFQHAHAGNVWGSVISSCDKII